jgi:hypothetical protein
MTAHVAYARRVNQWLEWGGSPRLPLGWKMNLRWSMRGRFTL